MTKPKLHDVMEEIEQIRKRRQTREFIIAILCCLGAGVLLYVFGVGLGEVFN